MCVETRPIRSSCKVNKANKAYERQVPLARCDVWPEKLIDLRTYQLIVILINGQAHKIPSATPEDGIFIDLDPGKYTYTLSVPGGAANGEVELGADQTWGFGVRGDGAVYTPSQLYP